MLTDDHACLILFIFLGSRQRVSTVQGRKSKIVQKKKNKMYYKYNGKLKLQW